MRENILIGVDLGTTVLKVCAFETRKGRLLAQASERIPVRALPDGGREQAPIAIRRIFARLASKLRADLGTAWHEVSGIGLAAQGGSSLIVDRASGAPLTPLILWNDARAHHHIARIGEKRPLSFWRRHVLRDFPPAGLGRLIWLREQRPELFHGGNLHVGAGELLFFALTGLWRQDPGHAIQIGSYDAGKRRLAPGLFDLIGVPLSFVAPLRRSHELATLSEAGARLTGLAPGLPVAGPYIDQEAGYLAARGPAGRPLHCSLGTAWVGNFTMPDAARGGSPFQLVLPPLMETGRFVIQPLLCGNTAWDWCLSTMLGGAPDRAIETASALLSADPLPPEGLVFFPYVTQRNPFDRACYGGGAFLGLSAQADRADLVRAVAAGLAFEFVRVMRAVLDSGHVDAAVLAGGAGKAAHFQTLLAELMAPLPVHGQRCEDLSTARGALYALDPAVAHAATRPIRARGGRLASRIRCAYDRYERVMSQALADYAEATPFHENWPPRNC